MATSANNPLVKLYGDRIGEPSTADEAIGYWVFIIGVAMGFAGIVMVMIGQNPGDTVRGAGVGLAALGLVMLLVGPIVRLPLERRAKMLSYLGAAVCVAAVVWFATAFPGSWSASFENSEVQIIGLYGIGILVVALGGILVPLLTTRGIEQEAAEGRAAEAESQRDSAIAEAQQRGRQTAAAEDRTARAESERDSAVANAKQQGREAAAAEGRAAEAESQRDSAIAEAQQRGRQTAAAEAERDELEAELVHIDDSQSQFEMYVDNAGEYRWRLRHRNDNIIADSAQGYATRQSAQQGLSAVKRDGIGAAVVDLEPAEADVTDVDEGVEGADAPVFVDDAESQATFEVYEDAGGNYRWRLRHENGNILADSGQGYASDGGRDDAVERVRRYAESADYLHIDPAAFEVIQDQAGQYRWRLLHENGNILADSGQGYTSRQSARQGLDSVRSNVGEGDVEFEVYEDAGGEHRWRLRHGNDNIIADCGQGYSSRSEAEDAVERVREYAPQAHVLDVGSAAFELFEDAAGETRWRLRHRNGNILADSGEGYVDRGGAEDGIHSVKRNAPNADVERTSD